ncbi:MAG: Sec-independent protein translocase protein TatB [Acidimicrobiia bacterium]|nr:Sec-independent protein translocase protein TatB [Acidimicrobiia bacterium]
MFNIGGGEVLVILLVALIVLGPDKLPQAARQVGRFTSEARKVADGFRSEMRSAMDDVADTGERVPRERLDAPPADAVPIEESGQPSADEDTTSGDPPAPGAGAEDAGAEDAGAEDAGAEDAGAGHADVRSGGTGPDGDGRPERSADDPARH